MSLLSTVLTATARTTSFTSTDIDTQAAVGAVVVVDITNVGTGSITVTISRKDSASGKYLAILASAALIANGTTPLKIHPNLAAVANLTAQDIVGQTLRIAVTANNANPVDYTVGLDLIKG